MQHMPTASYIANVFFSCYTLYVYTIMSDTGSSWSSCFVDPLSIGLIGQGRTSVLTLTSFGFEGQDPNQLIGWERDPDCRALIGSYTAVHRALSACYI